MRGTEDVNIIVLNFELQSARKIQISPCTPWSHMGAEPHFFFNSTLHVDGMCG